MTRFRWKRLLITVGALLLSLTLLTGIALAAVLFTVDTSARKTVYAPGETVNVDVVLNLADGQASAALGGIQIDLAYDSDLFTYESVSAEDISFVADAADDVPAADATVDSFLVVNNDSANSVVHLVYVNAALEALGGDALFTVNFKLSETAADGATGTFTVNTDGAYDTAAALVSGTDQTDKTFTITVEKPKGLLGDVNLDKKVNSTDAVMVLQASVKLITLSELQTTLADVNFDGKLNSTDAVRILQYAVKLITEFK
ncbi:MAG: hypothetical protein IJO10_09145 [Clostridia bacterium]|nr:hypothetical protein [Clostridia bacterium]